MLEEKGGLATTKKAKQGLHIDAFFFAVITVEATRDRISRTLGNFSSEERKIMKRLTIISALPVPGLTPLGLGSLAIYILIGKSGRRVLHIIGTKVYSKKSKTPDQTLIEV